MLRKSAMVAVVAGISLFLGAVGPVAFGSAVVSLNNPGSTTLHDITVAPGGTFNVDVNVDTDTQPERVLMRLEASAAAVIDVTGGSTRVPWTTQVFPIGNLDPVSPIFGASLPLGFNLQPGPSLVETLQFAIDGQATPGTYTLGLRDISFGLLMGTVEPWPGEPGPAFLVHVVPEPSRSGLMLAFTCVLLKGRSA